MDEKDRQGATEFILALGFCLAQDEKRGIPAHISSHLGIDDKPLQPAFFDIEGSMEGSQDQAYPGSGDSDIEMGSSPPDFGPVGA